MNTTESNKLIAEFMGGMFDHNNNKIGLGGNVRRDENGMVWAANHYWPNELQYHSSWGWLMPVVEKIEKLRLFTDKVETFAVIIYPYHTRIEQHSQHALAFADEMDFNTIEEDAENKIEATYKAIVKFITWYNQNK